MRCAPFLFVPRVVINGRASSPLFVTHRSRLSPHRLAGVEPPHSILHFRSRNTTTANLRASASFELAAPPVASDAGRHRRYRRRRASSANYPSSPLTRKPKRNHLHRRCPQLEAPLASIVPLLSPLLSGSLFC